MNKLLVGFYLVLVAGFANAGVGSYPNNKITGIMFYTAYGSGDVIVKGTNAGGPGSPCENGFWLRPDDAGFKSTLSALLSAYHTGVNIHIYADNSGTTGTSRWAGSGGWYCRIDSIGYGEW